MKNTENSNMSHRLHLLARFLIVLTIICAFAFPYFNFYWVRMAYTDEKVGFGCSLKSEEFFSPFTASVAYFTENAFNIHICYRKYFDYTLTVGSNGCTTDKTTSWYVTDWFSIETFIPLEDEEWDRILERKRP